MVIQKNSMRQVIAIIGTSHLYQFGGAALTAMQNDAFAELLRQSCHTHAISCLAEEMSHDALKAQDRTSSTVEELSHTLGLDHIYCDPSDAEQEALGLRIERNKTGFKHFRGWTDKELDKAIAAEHRIREGLWLEKLKDRALWPYLFVCGSQHAIHFWTLVRDEGFEAVIVSENWDALTSP